MEEDVYGMACADGRTCAEEGVDGDIAWTSEQVGVS